MHQTIYVMNRLNDTTSNHINAYKKTNKNYFKVSNTIFVVFCDIYEKKNLKSNARRTYTVLKQRKNESFAIFFSEFRRLNNLLQYFDHMLIDDLKNKLLQRFRNALANTQIKHISLSDMKIYLQSFDDDQRVMLNKKKRKEKYEQIRKQTATTPIKDYFAVVAITYKISASVFISIDFAIIIISRIFLISNVSSLSQNINC